LKALLAGRGSTLYRLTWKVVATAAGRPFYLLRGSVRPTSDIGYSGWASPKESDHRPGHASRMLDTSRINLNDQVMQTAGWATPNARDYRTPAHRSYQERGGGKKGENLNHQVAQQIPGASLNGLNAGTASGGLLNPAFSLWLLGIPATWRSCGPSAMRSARKSPPKSSKPG
jgi:hypothetical protein